MKHHIVVLFLGISSVCSADVVLTRAHSPPLGYGLLQSGLAVGEGQVGEHLFFDLGVSQNPPPLAAAAAAVPSGTVEMTPAMAAGQVGDHFFFDIGVNLASLTVGNGVSLWSVPLATIGDLAIVSVATASSSIGSYDSVTGEWRGTFLLPTGAADGFHSLGTIEVALLASGGGSLTAQPVGPVDGGFTVFGGRVPFSSASAPVTAVSEASTIPVFLFLGGVVLWRSRRKVRA